MNTAHSVHSVRILGELLIGLLLTTTDAFGSEVGIGSGEPGMKVATNRSGAVAIYRDEPQTVGKGLRGGMMNRNIEVLYDKDYGFRKDQMNIPEQLFPLDANSAFTRVGYSACGAEAARRNTTGYRVVDSKLSIIPDSQKEAMELYGVAEADDFLGFIDGRIFFSHGCDPISVYWKESKSGKVFHVPMPKGVTDVFGATKGIKKNFGVVVLRKSVGLITYSPFEFAFLEFSLSEGVASSAP
jgi:hypothetical protein